MPHFWLRLLAVPGVLTVIVAAAWWQTRSDRKEFSILRVLSLTFLSGLVASLFVLAWWWTASPEIESQRGLVSRNPLLLAAVFVPVLALTVVGLILAIRAKRKRHENIQF